MRFLLLNRSALFLAFVFSACSSTTLPLGGGGGTGGANLGGASGGANLGGASGGNLGGTTGGNFGGTTGGSPVTPLPSCLQDLEAACPTDGPCQLAADAGGVVRVCGSRAGCGPDGAQGQITVYKADGSLCYIVVDEDQSVDPRLRRDRLHLDGRQWERGSNRRFHGRVRPQHRMRKHESKPHLPQCLRRLPTAREAARVRLPLRLAIAGDGRSAAIG